MHIVIHMGLFSYEMMLFHICRISIWQEFHKFLLVVTILHFLCAATEICISDDLM
jgi:hypothetical protein